jgi:hypothetical protein
MQPNFRALLQKDKTPHQTAASTPAPPDIWPEYTISMAVFNQKQHSGRVNLAHTVQCCSQVLSTAVSVLI